MTRKFIQQLIQTAVQSSDPQKNQDNSKIPVSTKNHTCHLKVIKITVTFQKGPTFIKNSGIPCVRSCLRNGVPRCIIAPFRPRDLGISSSPTIGVHTPAPKSSTTCRARCTCRNKLSSVSIQNEFRKVQIKRRGTKHTEWLAPCRHPVAQRKKHAGTTCSSPTCQKDGASPETGPAEGRDFVRRFR